jgi:hypothetical protein
MNTKFDELAKGLAQSATRRQALKKFGVGIAGMALACFGLTNRTRAGGSGSAHAKYLCCTYFDIQGGRMLYAAAFVFQPLRVVQAFIKAAWVVRGYPWTTATAAAHR